MEQTYFVKNGIIHAEKGLPFGSRWFCDDRTSAQISDEGIELLDFFGSNTAGGGGHIVFRSCFWGPMRLYSITDKGRKLVSPGNCMILPFGFRGGPENCAFSVYLANNCLYITAQPAENMTLSLEFYDDFCFSPQQGKYADLRLKSEPRTWQPIVFENNRLTTSFSTNRGATNIMLSANAKLDYSVTSNYRKHILKASMEAGQTLAFCLSVSDAETQDWTDFAEGWDSQYSRYTAIAAKAPKLHSGNVHLDNFFQLAPMYAECLKIKDAWGLIRARMTRYWAWGWDTMTSNNCLAYWGDEEFLGHMLAQLKKYAQPGAGIAHSFSLDLRGGEAAPPPAQGMFLTVMDLYRQTGGDVAPYYDFAKELFDIILATEKSDTGLCLGLSLYPDFRELIRETGNDLSAFNNTVAYCAARSMARIAASMQDELTQQKADAFADRMLKNFGKIMYNPELGFIDSSVEADTLQRRNLGSNNAVKWESNDCADLVAGLEDSCLAFYEKNLVCEAGLRPVPEWDTSYDADGNQLHCWWMVMSEFYTRLANRANRADLMEQYAGWVSYWTERLTCPEGIPCLCNDKDVPFNNWNAHSGIWHGYSIRGFYNALVHSYVGVDLDHKGLNLYPHSGPDLKLEGLHFGSKTFDVTVEGAGGKLQDVIFNGQSLGPVTTIGWDMLRENNTLFVKRTT